MKPLRIAIAGLPMTTAFRRASGVLASCLLLSGELLAQSAVTVGWTGELGGDSGKHSPVRFTVRDDPAAADFMIISPSSDTTRVSNVRFDGPIVHFRAAFKTPAVCALRAAPPRGYTGLCDAGEGSTLTLSMMPPVPGLLLPAHEMALAREAAPAHLAEHASVFVLEGSGYHEVSGDDGYACYIWRPRTVDLWPICQQRDVTDALLPVERLRSRLRANGKVSEAAIEDSIARAYSTGVFQAPRPGSIGYMLSPHAWTLGSQSPDPTFLPPHLHIYSPGVTNASLGIDAAKHARMRVEREGLPDASIIVAPAYSGRP
jgi:hypothetical protein